MLVDNFETKLNVIISSKIGFSEINTFAFTVKKNFRTRQIRLGNKFFKKFVSRERFLTISVKFYRDSLYIFTSVTKLCLVFF